VNLFLNQSSALRLSTLCVLYAAQGIPDGFVRIALKTYLIGQNVSTEAVGTVVAMVSWPWAMKWVWGPFIDRYSYRPMGRRRPWILLAQTGMAIALATLLLTPDLTSSIRAIAGMVLLVNIFASLQDVSVDALAVDLLKPSERGVANGFMYGSNYAGVFIGGAVLGYCIQEYGFSTAVATQIGMLALIAAVPLMIREQPGDRLFPILSRDMPARTEPETEGPTTLGHLFYLLLRAFSSRTTLLAAVLAVCSLITVNSHLINWPVHLQRELGWSGADWLFLEGRMAVWFGLGGSLAGGVVASAIGAKRTVILSLGGLATCWFSYYFLQDQWTSRTVVTILFLVESMFAAFLQVSMFALFMGLCWTSIAATQFTAYMAMLNISNGIGAKLAGTIERVFEVPTAHLALGCLQLALIIVVLGIHPNEVHKDPGRGSTTGARQPRPGPIDV